MSRTQRQQLPAVSRRVFLRALSASASGSALTTWIACNADSPRAVTHADASLELPSALALPFLTPPDAFFVQAGGRTTVPNWSMPQLDAATHQIELTGLVQQALRLGCKISKPTRATTSPW